MRKFLCLLASLCVLSSAGFAQGYISGFVSDGGNPGGLMTDADNGGANWIVLVPTSQTTNLWSPATLLPFPFEFFGTPVTEFRVSPVGLVTFDVTSTVLPNANGPLPSTNLPDNTIAALWDDFPTGGTGGNDEVEYKVFGTAPNRQLWIRWFSMSKGTTGAGFFYGACVLEEGSNAIYVVDMWSSTATNMSATVGVQQDATNFLGLGSNFGIQPNTATNATDNDYWFFQPQSNGLDVRVASVNFSDQAENGCGTASESISIEVVNVGNVPATGIIGTFSVNGAIPTFAEPIPGTLQPGDTVPYTFITNTADLSPLGFNAVTGIATVPGDINISNDSITAGVNTIGPQALPLPVVDFTGYNSGNLPTITGNLWYEARGETSPTDSLNNVWFEDDWLNNTASPNGSAASITYSFNTDREWLVGPKFIPANNTGLSFDIGMTTSGGTAPGAFGSDDALQVMISTDCGATFTALATFDASNPVSNLGQTEFLTLSAFAGQEVILAFFATEGTIDDPGISQLFLDNIFLYNLPAIDVGISDIVQPVGGGCASPMGFAVVDVTNFGSDPIVLSATNPLQIDIEFTGANAQPTISFTQQSGTLQPGQTVQLPISNTVNLSNGGVTEIKAFTTLLGDGLAPNDTSVKVISTVPILGVPVLETFDTWTELYGYGAGWEGTPLSGYSWQVEANNSANSGDTGPDADHTTGNGAYIYTEASGSAAGQVTIMRSPCIDLTTAPLGAAMDYWFHMYGDDINRLDIEVWTDQGDTIVVDSVVGEVQTDETDPWIKRTVNLAAFSTNTIQIAFIGTSGGSFNGDIAIDDVFVYEVVPFDIAAVSVEGPATGCLTNADTVIGTIVNTGFQPIDFAAIPDTLTLDVGLPIPQVLDTILSTGIFPPGDTIEVAFIVDFSQGGTYGLTFTSALAPDGLALNDTATTQVESGSFTAPYYENFETFPVISPNLPFTWQTIPTTGYRWQGEDGPTTSGSTGPGVDHTTGQLGGIYLYAEASSGVQGDTATLISPCIDLGATPKLMEFWYHMYGVNVGAFRTYIIDANGIFTQEFSVVGEQDSAEAPLDPWNRVVIDLTAYAGQTINIAFVAERGLNFTADIAIDDILIYEPTGIDMGVTEMLAPDAGCFVSGETLGATITNLELLPIDFSVNPCTVTLELELAGSGTPVVFDTILTTGILNPGDSITLPTITTTADLSTPGIYELMAYTTVNNDAIPFNDTLEVEILSIPIEPTPYLEDFESFTPSTGFGDAGMITDGWRRNQEFPGIAWWPEAGGTSSFGTGPTVDHTLGNAQGIFMYTEANFPYGDSAVFVSPCIDLNGLTDPSLEFWYHMFGFGISTLDVYATNRQGTSALVFTQSGQQQSAQTDPYFRAFAGLSAFAGDTIDLTFVVNYGGSTSNDIAIDDVFVGEPTTTDLAVLEMVNPTSPGCLSGCDSLIVRIVNQGQAVDFATDSLTLLADITGPIGQAYPISVTTGTLGVGDTLDVLINPCVNFDSAGTYSVNVSLGFVPDAFSNNNSLVVQYLQSDTVAGPIGPVEFIGYNGSNLSTVYPGWDEAEGEGTPVLGTTSSWVSDDFANNIGGPNGTSAKINLWLASKDSWIIGPRFVVDSFMALSYDFAIHQFASNTVSGTLGSDDEVWVYISLDCGASYTPLMMYDNTTSLPVGGVTEFIDLTPYAGGEALIAFYATEGSTDDANDNDVFLDNILIRPYSQFDANVLSRLSPPNSSCGDTLTMGEFEIQNDGLDTLQNMPIQITVNGPNGQVVFNDTFAGPVPFGQSGTHMFGPFDTYSGGTYIIEGVAMLPGDGDASNDTLRDTVEILNAAPPLVLGVEPYCSGDSLVLVGDTAEDVGYLWYDMPVGGTPIATGDTFVTPALPTTSVTYYLEIEDPSFTLGAFDNAIGTGSFFGSASLGVQGLLVDVTQPFVLDSVAVYVENPGNVFLQVLDQATGTQVALAGPFPVTTASVKTFIPVNLQIQPGSYEFNAEGGNVGLYRNQTGAVYPYEVPGVVTITGNTFNPTYYYFFYDWHISGNACDRPRREIALAPDLPVAGFAVDSTGDLYLELSNQASNFDSVLYDFGDNSTSTMLNPVHTYADTGTYTVCQVAYNDCGPDTTCQTVTVLCEPAEGGFRVDSTGELFVEVGDLSTKADSIAYLWGDGTRTNGPTHMYMDTGTYTITQVAYHFCGNDTTEEEVTITCTFAEADFDVALVTGVNGATVEITGLGANADSATFDMGNGTTIIVGPQDTVFEFDYQFAGTYPVTMVVFNLCGTDTITQDVTVTAVGISHIDGGSIELFPNPTDRAFTLSLSLLQASNLNVDVVDARGRSVYRKDFETVSGNFSHRFEIDGLSEGMYLVKILAGDDLVIRKLQVE